MRPARGEDDVVAAGHATGDFAADIAAPAQDQYASHLAHFAFNDVEGLVAILGKYHDVFQPHAPLAF